MYNKKGVKMPDKLSIKGLGLSIGVLWGIYLFILGLASTAGINLPWFNAGIIQQLAVVYKGFSASIGGSFLGLIYGFVCGFVGGALTAWLYNKFA